MRKCEDVCIKNAVFAKKIFVKDHQSCSIFCNFCNFCKVCNFRNIHFHTKSTGFIIAPHAGSYVFGTPLQIFISETALWFAGESFRRSSWITHFIQMFHFYIPWKRQKTRECREMSVVWNTEAATRGVLLQKKVFFKISQYSQENTCVGVCFY